MRRDWDVIRHLLTVMEEHPAGMFELYPRDFAPVDPERAVYHLRLLRSAVCITGIERDLVGVAPADSFIATGLTMAGHDLAATLRSRTLWARIVETARERGLELTVEVIRALATRLIGELLP